MCVEHNEKDLQEFERKLRSAMRRREAPMGLKSRVLAESRARARDRQRSRWWMWQRVTAVMVLAAALGGIAEYRHVEEVRRGEAAREQVLTALRITSRTLNRVQERLSDGQ
jgi:hypothetical protein